MRITYIFHSCFIITDDEVQMVFDYPDFDALAYVGLFAQKIDIEPYIDPTRRVLFFSSHSHPDHFNPKIIDMMRNIPDSRFIFSNETLNIFPDYTSGMENRCNTLKPGDSVDIGTTHISAMASTDIGISFFIEHKGAHIFFPGDLALWIWEDLDRETKKEIEEIFNNTIMDIKQREIDILFVVVEPNLREFGWGGAVDAVRSLTPALTIPVHLRQQYSLIYEFKKTLPKGTKVFSYRRTGDYYDWEKKRGNKL